MVNDREHTKKYHGLANVHPTVHPRRCLLARRTFRVILGALALVLAALVACATTRATLWYCKGGGQHVECVEVRTEIDLALGNIDSRGENSSISTTPLNQTASPPSELEVAELFCIDFFVFSIFAYFGTMH